MLTFYLTFIMYKYECNENETIIVCYNKFRLSC